MCNNRLSLCKVRNCVHCEYEGNEENCPFAGHTSSSDAMPTFANMLEIYNSGESSVLHKRNVESVIKRDILLVGLDLDSKYNEMTRSKFKTLIEMLLSERVEGGPLKDVTVQTHLNAFKSISSEELEEKYSECGFELPMFSIPRFKVSHSKVQEISDRTIRLVDIQMEKWLASGKKSDIDAFAMCFFALYCGMRAGDICRAKWSILKRTNVGVMVVYKPHKTMKSTDKTVSFPIDNKTFCKIEPIIGKDDEYILRRYSNRASRHVTKCGEYIGCHCYLRNKVNKALSDIGIGNDYVGQKKLHALRKYFETDLAMRIGRIAAANACGHTLSVQQRSYLGSAYGKVA